MPHIHVANGRIVERYSFITKTITLRVDPEIGLNVIELGLVRDISLQDKQATLTMILTTPFCPYGPAMLEMTRAKAEEALKVPTQVEMGIEMWDLSYMEEGAGAEWGMW